MFPFSLLAGTVALSPLPFGSTDPVASCVWVVVLGVALICAKPEPRRRFVDPILLILAIVVIAAYLFVLAIQLDLVSALKLPDDPIWAKASKLLGQPVSGLPVAIRGQEIFALLNPLIALLALACAYLLCSDRDMARRLLMVIAISGLVYALIGLAFFLLLPDYVLWRKKYDHIGYLTATFMNRNTAAVYFAGCGLIWLLITARRFSGYAENGSLRKALRTVLDLAPRKVVYPAVACAICAQAVLFTGSRAGIVLALLGFAAGGVTYFWPLIRRRKFRIRRPKLLVLIGSAFLVALLLAQVIGRDRFQEQGLSDSSRFATYQATAKLIADQPWYGRGLGAFAWSYPPYRSPDVSIIGVWDRAHNVWLETAADGGIPLALIIGSSWLYILYRLGRGVLHRRRDRYIPIAAFGFVVLGLAHSLVDFSMQIPGFMIVMCAVAGAGLAQSASRGRRPSASNPAISGVSDRLN